MNKTTLVTVADDRFGRKNGLYGATQDKIYHIFKNNPQFGVHKLNMWNWDKLVKTQFYEKNKELLDNTDAGKNGRVYKPFAILDALENSDFGDFIIYTDCSPEIWSMNADTILYPKDFDVRVGQNLCINNNDILTCFVKWDNKNIGEGELGMHIHKYFTTNACMDKMGLREYENSYIHASGMFIIRKTPKTMEFVKEWLHWNTVDECCSLGKRNIQGDTSFWNKEHEFKVGHRHDQSISGLLINKMDNPLIDILYNEMSPYNPLQFCRTNSAYKFIDSNSKPPREEINLKQIFIGKGSIVINERHTELKVFDVRIEGNIEYFKVGQIEASCYETTRQFIKLKQE
jgi:hypothetical protein